jgi:organic radical activating enzyme
VHVSGGEPLLWDGIENAVQMLVNAGIDTTITTNGLLIEKRARLLDMPLKWLVTYHSCSDFEKWRRNAALIRKKPHLACCLAGYGVEVPPAHIKRFDDFNFAISRINGLRIIDWQPQTEDMRRIASETIHLIEPDGRVFPCNNRKAGEIGNIGGMWYDKALARSKDRECFQCVRGSHCQAYQSAALTAFSLRAG